MLNLFKLMKRHKPSEITIYFDEVDDNIVDSENTKIFMNNLVKEVLGDDFFIKIPMHNTETNKIKKITAIKYKQKGQRMWVKKSW